MKKIKEIWNTKMKVSNADIFAMGFSLMTLPFLLMVAYPSIWTYIVGTQSTIMPDVFLLLYSISCMLTLIPMVIVCVAAMILNFNIDEKSRIIIMQPTFLPTTLFHLLSIAAVSIVSPVFSMVYLFVLATSFVCEKYCQYNLKTG